MKAVSHPTVFVPYFRGGRKRSGHSDPAKGKHYRHYAEVYGSHTWDETNPKDYPVVRRTLRRKEKQALRQELQSV